MSRLAEVWGVGLNQACKTYQKLYDWEAYNDKSRADLEKKHAGKRKAAEDNGEEDNPKFSLRYLFDREVFPSMENPVAGEGEYGGYKSIFRGDNDGPHREKKEEVFDKFCEAYCKAKGWGWEPQSENSPDFNNNNLTLFPAMSKRHSIVLKRSYGRKVADKE